MTPPSLAMLGLVLITGLLILAPLLPGLLELHRRRDAEPLVVIAASDRDIRHFAQGFRSYVVRQLSRELPASGPGEAVEQTLPDGTSVIVIRRHDPSVGTVRRWRRQPVEHVMVVRTPLTLPGQLVITAEVYATEAIRTGPGCTVRAILADADLDLGEDNVVLRWLHGEANVGVGQNSVLYGRASAEGVLQLAEGIRFQRIQAARIEFGASGSPPAAVVQPAPERDLGNDGYAILSRDCWMAPENCEISASTRIGPSLVVRGDLLLGAGTHALRCIKGRQSVTIERDCRVDGSVVSGGAVRVGEECRIGGPIIAEGEVHLAAGAVVGQAGKPTTISADRFTAEPGVVVFGVIWTRTEGRVLQPRAQARE